MTKLDLSMVLWQFKEGKKSHTDCLTAVDAYTDALIAAKPDVIRSLPGGDDINSAADDYGFRVPYDGTNNFYDEIAIKHFHAGVRWYEQFLTGNDV